MTIMAQKVNRRENWNRRDSGRESIHSGHFMISDFEAEALQDEEDELAVPVPEVAEPKAVIPCHRPITNFRAAMNVSRLCNSQLSIETSLTKLFQCMSIAYRQKLTSPKWNRFKGVRLRWKDKIRLNNVIWRCWHMQFINKQSTLVCQFASPLDVDTHNKPEAIVLEGKYWKRKLHAVTAEYKKWRMFTHNQILGRPDKYGDILAEFGPADWHSQISDSSMMVDEDYMSLMSDTLFSAISGNVPFPFPDTRELARGTNLADFIQPSLVQLQPSLDEIMDIEPLTELLYTKLPPVPEEPLPQPSGYSKSVVIQHGSSQQAQQSQEQAILAVQAYQQNSSMYPVWYIPPSNFSQQSLYQQQQQPPPPPPPPPHHISPPVHKDEQLHTVVNKPKLKHRSRSSPSINKKLVGTTTPPPSLQSELNTAGLHHSLPSSTTNQQTQSSALLEQLLTSSSSSLYQFLEPESSSVPKMPAVVQQVPPQQCVDVPYMPNSYEEIDGSQLLYQSQHQRNVISNQQKSYSSSPDKSSIQLSPTQSEPSPSKASLLSPVTGPSSSQNNSIGGSCPNSPLEPQEHLSLSPLNMGSPSSPKSIPPGYKEHRRVCHINAEQKRRCNIKNGFDTLHSLIPQLKQNPNTKMSKAAMLQKGADYIVQLRNERSSLKQEMESLKQQIESLNSTISNCQSMLPVTGAPVSRQRSSRMRDMFRQYIRTRTLENWKFWILSLIFEPLLESFNNIVSTSSVEDLYQTTLQWVDQHCSLLDLRPVVLNALRHLCTTTDVLSDPSRLPTEARGAVEKPPKKSANNS